MRWDGMVLGLAGMLALAGCASTDTAAPVMNLTNSGQAVGQRVLPSGQHLVPTAGPGGYTVQKGDTLYSIALEKGLDYHDLATWNHLTDINHIRVGQVLQIHPPGEPGAGPGSANAQAIPLKQAAVAAQPVGMVTSINQPQAVKLRWSPAAVKQIEAADAASSSGSVPVATQPSASALVPASAATSAAANAASAGNAPSGTPTGDWAWPTEGKVISQFGGPGIDGKGIDIAGTRGQPVDAVTAGKVVYSGAGLHGYGKLVIIKHSATFLTAYAHNEEVMVKEGQAVTKGQQIAKMGDSDADRVELHFEVRQLGQPVDPMKFLPAVTP